VPIERMGDVSPGYTAHRAVNAVPVVCAATPGIRTTVDLPQVVATLG
jgi:4-hydroxy-tetrahydrodipicolinate reductase